MMPSVRDGERKRSPTQQAVIASLQHREIYSRSPARSVAGDPLDPSRSHCRRPLTTLLPSHSGCGSTHSFDPREFSYHPPNPGGISLCQPSPLQSIPQTWPSVVATPANLTPRSEPQTNTPHANTPRLPPADLRTGRQAVGFSGNTR